MNERMKRILELVKQDIDDNAATIEYQKIDAAKKVADKELKNLKPKVKPLNVSNLMVGND